MRGPTRRGGFTLLEVVISLAILVVAIAAILPLFAVGSRSHKRGIDQTMVSLIAPHIVAKLQERLVDPNPADVTGAEFTEQGRTYRYDATFEPVDAADAARSAFFVTVTVRWSELRDERTETFKTILLRRLAR